MWRKTADAKNPSQSSNVPEPVGTTPKTAQNSPALPNPAGPSPIAQTSTPASTSTTVSTQNAAPSYSSPATAGNPFAGASRANSVSVIGAGLKIQGEITGDSDLVIEGEAHGRIRIVNGRVTVAANGHVNADIEAVEISVEGSVQGGLKASDRVRLGASSRVQGSVMTPRIAIEDGARLRGKVEMIRAGEVEAPATKPALGANSVSSTSATVAPAIKTPVTTTVTPTSPSAGIAASNTNSAAAKAPDAATAAIATEADKLKATAARGSGN
jgi:cytoskeletal protein CcmA (bactofilin family)